MPGQNLLQFIGGGAQKQTRYVSLFTSRFLIGLYTNRSPLRGPMDSIYSDYYHMGATDALLDGLNSELSSRSTLIRRPGNPKFSTAQTASAIDAFYSFHQSDGTIQLIADSTTDVEVMTPSSGTSIFTKSVGAGQSYFQGVNKSLYIGDGVDTVKYIPSGNTNPITSSFIWNWGGVAPTVAPTLVITESGSAAATWSALTWFSTMGIIVDNNGNAQQLISVNADGTNPSTQIGLSGNGAPTWNQTPGSTTVDNTVTWTNLGPVGIWKPNTGFNGIGGSGGTLLSPAMIYDEVSGGFYANSRTGTGFATGSVKPTFSGIVGGNYFDGSCNWVCYANAFNTSGTTDTRYGTPMFVWQSNHVYAGGSGGLGTPNSALIEPYAPPPLGQPYPTNHVVYFQYSGGGTSHNGAITPTWGTAGQQSIDGQLQWIGLGSATWGAGATVVGWTQPNTHTFNVVKDTANCLQVCIQSGITGGSAPWKIWVAGATHQVASSTTSGTNVITDSNGNLQFVSAITTGVSAGSPPTWNTTFGGTTTDGGVTWTNNRSAYGSTTTDGTAVWVNVGLYAGAVWAAAQNFYLPKGGFFAPNSFNPYGGADILDTNSNVEFIINTGLSGGSTPSWSATIGTRTTDGTATWYNNGPASVDSFSWTSGFGYCFSYKARKSTDAFVTAAPPLWTNPLGVPTGCGDGTITTASPVIQVTGANAGAIISISGPGSTDPQFDTVEIYRSTDGFGAGGPYLFLTDIPMPTVIGGVAGTWSVIDFMPDKATNTLPGLNPLIEAPIDHVNDPPPGQFGSLQFVAAAPTTPTLPAVGSALQGVVYHQGRLWGFIGNSVFASGGPDTDPGNGFTAWPPDQVYPFDSGVVRLLSTVAGLFVFTKTDVGFIGGGPAITAYESQVLFPGIGVLSPNAVTTIAGLPYVFTTDRQVIGLDPNGGITRVAHNIGDKLVAFDPANVYLTYHSFGDLDNALFISDGSTQWYRCDINMVPDGKYTGPVWSPRATIAGGFKALQSIETSSGVRNLLIGPTGSGYVLARDSSFTNFQDNGSPYQSDFTMGCIVLAHPGQMAQTDFIEMDFQKKGTLPTVSIMFDEISATNGATFETISNAFVSDPPKLYGPTGTPNTIWMNRYYFDQTTPGNTGGTPLPAWCKFLQLKVDFGNTDIVQNELLAFTIFGALWADK